MSDRALLLAVLLAFPRPSEAQTAGRGAPQDSIPAQLPPIEVITSILGGPGPAIGSGVPARSASVAGETIRRWKPPLLTDALNATAGFSLYDDLGSGSKTTLVSRGFTAGPVVGLPQGISVFIDGVPVNEPDARQVNFDLLPVAHVRRIEMLSGAATLLGPNSIAGSINLVTLHGSDASIAEVELNAGSHGARAYSAGTSGTGRGWSYYAGATHVRERGWREATDANRADGFLNVGRYGAERGFNVQLHGARSYAGTAGSLPLSVYRVNPRLNLTPGDFEDLKQLHSAVTRYVPAAGGRVTLSLYARGSDAERFNVNQINDPDVRSFAENRTVGGSADWRWERRRDHSALAVLLGGGGSLNRSDVRIFAERVEPGLTTRVRSPIADGGFFAASEWTRGRLTLSGGLRLDAVRIPFRNVLDPLRDTTSMYTQLNPRAGAVLNPGDNVAVYASAGRSFRAPAVIELACADPEDPCPLPFALGDDPPLDPVTAVTYETGLRWRRSGVSLDASLFRTDVRNEIFLFPYADESEPQGSTIDGYFANVATTRRDGLEVEGRAGHGGAVAAYLSYSWTRATFRTGGLELFSVREAAGSENEIRKGDRLPLVPTNAWRGGVDAALPRGIELGIAGRYTGRRFLRGDEANEEEPLDSYVIVDARAAYDVGQWRIQGVARNVGGTRYAAFGTFNIHQDAGGVLERFLTPGQPRTFQLSLRRRFGG